MILSIIIFLITYFLIATEKMDKTVAALLGAAAVIICRAVPYDQVLGFIDMNVIFLLIGMMITVNILARTGIFEWIAITIAQKAKGNGLLIVVELAITTAILSAFLDNVTTVLLIAPITILVAQILELPAVPILIIEALFSNIGGTATLVGDPPNIIIGSQVGFTFIDFLVNLGPVIIIILVVVTIMLLVFFKNSFSVSDHIRQRIIRANPSAAIVEPKMLMKAIPVFILLLVGFFFGHIIHVEPGILALAAGALMALVCKVEFTKVIEKVDWGTVLFFIGLFMLISALEVNGVLDAIGQFIVNNTGGNLLLTALAILWFSALCSALVDNIPLVIAMLPVIKGIIPAFALHMNLTETAEIQAQIGAPLFWALALGACLGGNGSLVGASANVVIVQLARRNKYKLSFWDFTRFGFPVMIISLLISTVYIWIRYF